MRSSDMDVRRTDVRLSDEFSDRLSERLSVNILVKMPIVGLSAVGSGLLFLLEMMN